MLPVQITIRNIPSSTALESHIRKRVEKLNQFYDRINSCRVVVDLPQKHKHQGKLYHVHLDMTVPGKELVVSRKMNEDVYVAVRDAFNALARQLEEHAKKRHGRIKTHEKVVHGHIARLKFREGYGFIQGLDGNEYYFSLTNVHYPSFEQLMIGDAVEYIPVPLNEGWQAQHVIKERSNHLYAA